ncbi:DDE_3 domain-containing protein [Trichonephila clavipes]|nr:DDE_3 domain-containing protein [Trichonephila clavipes]
MTGHIYREVILEQHVRLFRGPMGAEFLFMDDNARPHRANIVDECLQSEDITRIDWSSYSSDLNPIEQVDLTAQTFSRNLFKASLLPARVLQFLVLKTMRSFPRSSQNYVVAAVAEIIGFLCHEFEVINPSMVVRFGLPRRQKPSCSCTVRH